MLLKLLAYLLNFIFEITCN